MRFLAAFTLLIIIFAAPAQAEEGTPGTADRAAIQSVIQRQIAAFARDDAAAAFAFASPAIQRQFGSPERFLHMVQTGYRAVYRARSVSFGDLRRIDGHVVQEVDVIGPDGLGVHAFYLMEREGDGGWRINGVSLTPSSARET